MIPSRVTQYQLQLHAAIVFGGLFRLDQQLEQGGNRNAAEYLAGAAMATCIFGFQCPGRPRCDVFLLGFLIRIDHVIDFRFEVFQRPAPQICGWISALAQSSESGLEGV